MSDMNDVARAFFAYVNDRSRWTEATWDTAVERKLAVRRVKRNPDGTMGAHFYTLTDEGLDLYNAGKSNGRSEEEARTTH